MTITPDLKECLNELSEKYFRVVKFVKEHSKLEDETATEFLLSRVEARQNLILMKVSIENLIGNEESPDHKRLSVMLAIVYIYLGTIIDNGTMELSEAELYLNKSLELMEHFKEDPSCLSIQMNVYNQLGILWFQKDAEKAKQHLDKSVELYNANKHNIDPPKSMDNFFETEITTKNPDELWENFETIHTNSLYYLAQVYGSLNNALKSAIYCHMTLKRQLVYKTYEPIDWSLNAATLSQYFAAHKAFKQARHHLSASSYILDSYKRELGEIQIHDESYNAKIEEFNHRSADVARCWAQYGNQLLTKSRERLMEQSEKDEPNYLPTSTDLAELENANSTVSHEDLNNLFFPSLDLKEYEEKVTDKFVLTLIEAKLVFLNAQNWFNESQKYYTLDNLASDFIEITLSHSQLYQELVFFDDDMENQAKYHKRRIDLLENVLDKINPQYYSHECRNMWYECGHAYFDLLNIKLDKLRENNERRPTPHSLSKINSIVTKALKHFNTFINSFEKLNGKIDEIYYSSFAKAQYYIGALYGKYITLDKQKILENTEARLDAYKKLVEFCKKHEAAKDTIQVEYSICAEMIELLPVRIEKLRSEVPH